MNKMLDLIVVLVSAGGEEVDGVVEVEVVVTEEVATDELVDGGLVLGVQALELVGHVELLQLQSIWQDHLCLPLQCLLCLERRDVRHRREHCRRLCCTETRDKREKREERKEKEKRERWQGLRGRGGMKGGLRV